MLDKKYGLRPCAVAFAVALALALGLSGCGGGGGGGANVRPTPPSPPTPPTPPVDDGGFTGGEVNVDSGDILVWPDDISGSIDLIKIGAGTLVLAGTDSYGGGTTISEGTLQIGNGGTTGSIIGDVTDNAFLVFNRSNDLTFNGIVSGSGSLEQAGKGTLTLTGANTYAGGTTISRGILQIGNGGTIGSIVGDVANNGSLVLNRSDNVTFKGIVSGNGSLEQAGKGTLTLTGANTYTGGTTISHGTLQLGNGGGTGSITGDVMDNGSLVFNRSDNLTFKGIVSGRGALEQVGTGTLLLTGANTYTGGTTISHGILQLGNGGGTGSILGDVTVNGFLVFNRSNDVTFNGIVSGSGSLEQAGKGTLTLTGTDTYTGGTTISHGTLRLGNGGTSGSILGDVIDNGALLFNRSDDVTFSGIVTGSGSLEQAGMGTLTLTGANTYTGGTTISHGSLWLGNGGNTGSILGDVADNGSLVFNRSDDMTFNGIVSGTGSVVQSGPGKLTLTGTSTYAGGTTVTGGALKIAAGATLGTGSVTVGVDNLSMHSGYTLQVDHGASLSNRIVLEGFASLDNAGALGGNVDFGVEGDSDVQGENSAAARNSRILNHDGGSIRGNNAGVMFYGYLNAVENIGGGIIEGGNIGIGLGHGGSVLNDGVGSTILSSGIAIQSTVDGGHVQNRGGGIITGGAAAVGLKDGGFVYNDGTGSTISSPAGTAIRFALGSGDVSNSGGATITSGSTTIYLQNGGSVSNGAGSTIETTGTTGGDCASTGDCAIFVASDSQTPGGIGGELKLANAGNIVGNVQLNPAALNDVTLWTGSSIQGNLDIGSNPGALLTLAGDAALAQSYSQAATGSTTFVGNLYKKDAGTWVVDNNSLMPSTIKVDGGTLQIGKGGTEGFIGASHIELHGGTLAFDRSDDVVLDSDIDGYQQTYGGRLVQAGTGTLTLLLTDHQVNISGAAIKSGILQLDNTGGMPSQPGYNQIFQANLVNDGSLVANSNASLHYTGEISGTGSVTQNGSGNLILEATNTYTGGTTINNGTLLSVEALPGNVMVNTAGTLDGYSLSGLSSGVPRVDLNLSNAGRVAVHGGDSIIGSNYVQSSTGTLAVSLGSKLDVTLLATLNGGTLEVTGADSGYVSNTHTEVLTTGLGVHGTFNQLVKSSGVVFTATTINYDDYSVWLDTTGLNVTTAATGQGVSYTPASMGSAQRVQGAFEQLNDKIAAGKLDGVSGDFLHAAGQFQQSPTLQAAQASLQSLSGQLHAASAAMTFKAIDASSRALSDRFDNLLDKGTGFGMWMHNLNVGGDMARAGFDGVGFQLNGWLVGSDRRIGHSGVAGYAFGQSRGQQRLDQSFDHDNSRSTEGMMYAGWLNGNWYTQGRVGFGHFEQDVSRQVLLGDSVQGVRTQYNGNYNVAYGESGLHLGRGDSHVTPFINVQYARIDRGGFAEQGAGGFGLRSNAQTLDRWQAGLGVRAGHHWNLDGGRAVDFSVRAQWQRTLASHGDVFNASFVGLQQWQPLVGIGLSRYSGLLGVGLDATLSAHTTLKFGYDYEMGQRDNAQMLSARLNVAF